jgi:sortase A
MSLVWSFLHRAAMTLAVTGALVVGFVPYQLWGTGLETARTQRTLSEQFEQALATNTAMHADRRESAGSVHVPHVNPDSTVAGGDTAANGASVPSLSAAIGAGVSRLQIPKIGLDQIVVLGVSRTQLRAGPGLHPSSAAPGSVSGNTVIAGHRTTYGAPFWALNELDTGDEITLTTTYGTFTYTVTSTSVRAASDPEIARETQTPQLTLYTCEPKYSVRQRLVVTAAPSSPTTDVAISFGPGTADGQPAQREHVDDVATSPRPRGDAAGDSGEVAGTAGSESSGAADEQLGWNADPSAWRHLAVTGALFAAIAVVAGRVVGAARRWWKVAAVTAAVPAAAVSVWWLYGAVNAVVPAGM